MSEDLLPVLLLKDAVYQVATEQLQLDLAPKRNVLRNFLVGFREDMSDDQSIGLLKITEFHSLEAEVLTQTRNIIFLHVLRHVIT
jgi:hypothetical protein